MKGNLLFLFLLILNNMLFAQDKPTLAVVKLDSRNIPADKLEMLSNRLQSELYRTDKYVLLERMKINAVMQELGFQQAGYIDVNQAVEVGKMLGAEKIVFGNMDKVDNTYSADIRLVDVKTSRIESIARKDFHPPSTFDFILSQGMENIARRLTGLPLDKDYEKIAANMYESECDPGFRLCLGLSLNRNADGKNHIDKGGYMKNLIGLSLGLESAYPGFGGYGGFTYYFWEQRQGDWDVIMEFTGGCHYKYKFIRAFAGLDCHMIFLKDPGPIQEDVWTFGFLGSTVYPFVFGYEYGGEFVYRVGFLTDIFLRYKRFSYFADLEPKGIVIGDNSFATFVFGVKAVLGFVQK